VLTNLRILTHVIPYYKLTKGKNLTPLATLVNYKAIRNNMVHVHFNSALKHLVELSSIGYINPKCIVTFHGYDAFLEDNNSFEEKYGEFYRQHVVAVTVNSNYLANQVKSLGIHPALISIIPIGIDTKLFSGIPKNFIGSTKVKLISIGRLVPGKGFFYSIQMVNNLKSKGYNVNYNIIGGGYLKNELSLEIRKLNLQNEINFLGSLGQSEIINHLNSSHIFIFPSTYDDELRRREAFGVVSIEAQAMGLPVVGFDSGGFPETILQGETGFAVEDRNVDALASKIEYLIDNPEIYAQMSSKAKEHAKNYDHELTTQRYLNLYQNFLTS
jgi:colanic acid/amylovoran biosynthesis glycosyltransferase